MSFIEEISNEALKRLREQLANEYRDYYRKTPLAWLAMDRLMVIDKEYQRREFGLKFIGPTLDPHKPQISVKEIKGGRYGVTMAITRLLNKDDAIRFNEEIANCTTSEEVLNITLKYVEWV